MSASALVSFGPRYSIQYPGRRLMGEYRSLSSTFTSPKPRARLLFASDVAWSIVVESLLSDSTITIHPDFGSRKFAPGLGMEGKVLTESVVVEVLDEDDDEDEDDAECELVEGFRTASRWGVPVPPPDINTTTSAMTAAARAKMATAIHGGRRPLCPEGDAAGVNAEADSAAGRVTVVADVSAPPAVALAPHERQKRAPLGRAAPHPLHAGVTTSPCEGSGRTDGARSRSGEVGQQLRGDPFCGRRFDGDRFRVDFVAAVVDLDACENRCQPESVLARVEPRQFAADDLVGLWSVENADCRGGHAIHQRRDECRSGRLSDAGVRERGDPARLILGGQPVDASGQDGLRNRELLAIERRPRLDPAELEDSGQELRGPKWGQALHRTEDDRMFERKLGFRSETPRLHETIGFEDRSHLDPGSGDVADHLRHGPLDLVGAVVAGSNETAGHQGAAG